MDIRVLPGKLTGTVCVPPSKSAAHRAIIAAALADGESIIENVDLSSDIRATVGACGQFGCVIEVTQMVRFCTLKVRGGIKAQSGVMIDCAESGSTLRFMIPVACVQSGDRTFIGHGRLPQRPIDAYLQIFDEQGIRYTHPRGSTLPLTLAGALKPGCFCIDGRVSSQFITGLLYALPLLKGDSEVEVIGGFESRGYVDLTIDMLHRFGVEVSSKGDRFFISGSQTYKPQQIAVEGDFSQAAFFLVAGAISGGLRVEGLAQDSLQPDSVIVDILKNMNANITCEGSAFVSAPAQLTGIDIDVSQCPDLVPPLAIAAAFAQGTTRITGAARLRIKESDRLSALAQNLNSLGVKAEEQPEGVTIYGGPMKGGQVDSFGDHRIAMAFSVAAAASGEGITIHGSQSVDKSYPKFFEDFAKLGGNIE